LGREPALGYDFGLEVRPNPFSGQTTFHFRLPADHRQAAQLEIFDPLGQRVRRFSLPGRPGEAEIRWDGCDQAGTPLPTGLYLYRLGQAGRQQQGKIWLQR
jgi:hypothetical protein